MIRFTKSDLEKIENSVRSAESKTSGEIVPIVVEQSVDTVLAHAVFLFLGLFLAVLADHGVLYFQGWGTSPWTSPLIYIGAFVISFLLARSSAAIRFVFGKSFLQQKAYERACFYFLNEGLAETRDRTGILIFISLTEHLVVILGDKGIHSKLGDAYWKKNCNALAKHIGEKNLVVGLCECIQHLGMALQEYFPIQPSDRNELKDGIRVRD